MSSKFYENGYLTPSTVHKIGRFLECSLLPLDHGTGAWSILRESNLCQGHSETGPDGGGWWNSEQETSRQIVMEWRLSPDFPTASMFKSLPTLVIRQSQPRTGSTDQSQLGPESSSVTQLTVEARAFTSLGLNKSDVNLSQSEHNSLILLTWP